MAHDMIPDIQTKPDWWYVGYDQTSHWNLDLISPQARRYISEIITVFAVNRGEQTYCCELTPSYWMEAISHEPIYTKELWEDPDHEKLREEIYEFCNSVNPSDSSGYMHSRRVDNYINTHKKWTHQIGTTDQDLYEIWHSNPKF